MASFFQNFKHSNLDTERRMEETFFRGTKNLNQSLMEYHHDRTPEKLAIVMKEAAGLSRLEMSLPTPFFQPTAHLMESQVTLDSGKIERVKKIVFDVAHDVHNPETVIDTDRHIRDLNRVIKHFEEQRPELISNNQEPSFKETPTRR